MVQNQWCRWVRSVGVVVVGRFLVLGLVEEWTVHFVVLRCWIWSCRRPFGLVDGTDRVLLLLFCETDRTFLLMSKGAVPVTVLKYDVRVNSLTSACFTPTRVIDMC